MGPCRIGPDPANRYLPLYGCVAPSIALQYGCAFADDSAWSADNVVPSASMTTTPFFDVKIADTVAFKRTWPSAGNSLASA